MKPHFELKKTKDDKHHFTLVAGNGEVVAQSETYESKQGAKNGILAVVSIIKDMLTVEQEINIIDQQDVNVSISLIKE
jgi:uncharacterized protein YegP (UPF0339 family)